jgi:hypothetical protein
MQVFPQGHPLSQFLPLDPVASEQPVVTWSAPAKRRGSSGISQWTFDMNTVSSYSGLSLSQP